MSAPIKTETPQAAAPIRSPRLKGFKVPRDLSLAGLPKVARGASTAAAAANKKVFTPNLNVTRNKSTPKTDEASPSNGRGRGAKTDRGRGRGGQNSRGRGKGPNHIQSVGLFSEGIAQQPLRRSAPRAPCYNEGAAPQRKPMLVKSTKAFDESAEQQSLKEFLNDDDTDGRLDSMLIEDDFSIPVVLRETPVEVATEPERPPGYPESLSSFFDRKTPQLFLIQLPDTLPGQGNEIVTTKKNDDSSTAETNGEGEEDQKNFCSLRGLQEGLIGKFIRYKSGKTKLVLGNTRFDVDLGLNPGFLQEVMSVRTNSHERNGDMVNLGKISAKMNVSPDWEHLFQNLNGLSMES